MPMSSDHENRAADTRWQPRGVGLQPTFRCTTCDKQSLPLGSRKLGLLKRQHCAACVPGVLAKIEAKRAAKAAAKEPACL